MASTQLKSKPTAPAKAAWNSQETTPILHHLNVAMGTDLTGQDSKGTPQPV